MIAAIAITLGAAAAASVVVAHRADIRSFADDPSLPAVSTTTSLTALALFVAGVLTAFNPEAFDPIAITASIASIAPLSVMVSACIRLHRIPLYGSQPADTHDS